MFRLVVRRNTKAVAWPTAGNDVFLIPATPSATAELRRVFGDDKGYVKRGGDCVWDVRTLNQLRFANTGWRA